jgi:hypothetical protein
MINAEYYEVIYYTIVAVATFCVCQRGVNIDKKYTPVGAYMLCVFLIMFIGFRPMHRVFIDTLGYYEAWALADWVGFDFNAENLIFDNIYIYLGASGLDISWFFLLIASIYFGTILAACQKLFPNNILLSFLVCLGAFSTYSYSMNGIKAGAAASIFLLGITYRDKLFISLPLVLISWGFHHSMQLPVAAYCLALIFKNKNWYFYGWLFCLLMAIGHVSFFQNIFAGITDESGADYLTKDEYNTIKGFRLDFIIYSSMPVLMGYMVKYEYRLEEKIYDMILNTYLVCNAVWMLCMYAAFTNRIAYLSWFMYPIVLIYPCFAITERSHPLVVNRNKIIVAHLTFTLFMAFIY